MRNRNRVIFVTAALLLCTTGLPCRSEDLTERGRQIFAKNQHAVVTVEVVLKASYSAGGRSGQASETKQDLTGTVVDPSGLTVLSLSACDPADMYQRMVGDANYKVETEVLDVKLLLEDDSEVPAEIVLRDKDLDLAFVRPKTKPANPMPAVDLTKSSPAQVLDQVITINRLNRAAGRAYSASVERVSAVISKPRTFYIPDSTMTTTALGSPAFALDGNLVGVMVMRAISAKGGAGRDFRQNMTSVILRAEDVLKAARQAPKVKPESEKKQASKETEAPNEAKEPK